MEEDDRRVDQRDEIEEGEIQKMWEGLDPPLLALKMEEVFYEPREKVCGWPLEVGNCPYMTSKKGVGISILTSRNCILSITGMSKEMDLFLQPPERITDLCIPWF